MSMNLEVRLSRRATGAAAISQSTQSCTMGRSMRPASVPWRPLLLLGVLTLLLAHAGKLYAQPAPDSVNLSVFTSPIDMTGLPLVLRVSAPERESGRLVDIAVPPGFLGPKFLQLLATPISAQFDRFWNVDPDPIRGQTVRAS